MGSEIRVEPAREEDVPCLAGVEARAAARFSLEELPAAVASETRPEAQLLRAQAESRLLVARHPEDGVVGFALLERYGEEVQLEELDVEPDHGRRGIGRALVEAAIAWAASRGAARIALSTFRDVPWNAPFYARCGFEVLPPARWTGRHRALREEEAAHGLDVSRRVIMQRALSVSQPASSQRQP